MKNREHGSLSERMEQKLDNALEAQWARGENQTRITNEAADATAAELYCAIASLEAENRTLHTQLQLAANEWVDAHYPNEDTQVELALLRNLLRVVASLEFRLIDGNRAAIPMGQWRELLEAEGRHTRRFGIDPLAHHQRESPQSVPQHSTTTGDTQ